MMFQYHPFDAIMRSCMYICSRSVEKYFRGGSRLNWPEGAVSRESIRGVKKLDRLKVRCILVFISSFFKPELHSFFFFSWYILGEKC